MSSARRWDVAVFVALVVGVTVLVGATSLDVGFTRDEGFYFTAAQKYWGWFEALTREGFGAFSQGTIDRYWEGNHEHPVLLKSLFALSWGLLKKTFGLFALHSSALRFPAWCFSGLCVALTFALGRTVGLRRGYALVAGLAFLAMPRAYWHMHLACFDIGVCAAHLWLVIAYLKWRKTPRGAVVVGALFGLAIAVKHNVLVTPAFFVLHWMLSEAKEGRFTRYGIRLPPLPLVFFTLAVIGPVVFVAHWPYLWPDPIRRIGFYLGFHLGHEHYPIMWFKALLTEPPFPVSFPFVMTTLTVPLPQLLLMLGGVLYGAAMLAQRYVIALPRTALAGLRDPSGGGPGSAELMLLLNAAFPFLLIALPSSPIFGGTKHWMNALPFLLVLGAGALDRCAALWDVRSPSSRRPYILVVLTGIMLIVPGALQVARSHPYGLSSYNSLIGFSRGAANAGLQRTFWGYEVREALDEISEKAPKRARMMFGDTNRGGYNMIKKDKLLRGDVTLLSDAKRAHVAAVEPQGEFKREWMKVLDHFNTERPDRVVHIEGVPLLTVTYKRDPTAAGVTPATTAPDAEGSLNAAPAPQGEAP